MSETPEMVERVAKVLCENYCYGTKRPLGDSLTWQEKHAEMHAFCSQVRKLSRLVIAAMMEPTDEMIDAGINAKSALYAEFERQGINTRTLVVANHPAGTIYKAMVREALKP